MTSLAHLFWMPDLKIGQRLVAGYPAFDDPIQDAWIALALKDRPLLVEQMPLAHAGRCWICNSSGPATFLLRRTTIQRTHGGGLRHVGDTARYTCINCNKSTQAADTSPLSAHAVLRLHAQTLARLPRFFGREDLLFQDGLVLPTLEKA